MVKRVILGIVAAILVIAGVAAASAAFWLSSAFGPAGVLSFDAGTITPGPADRATIIDIDRFGATVPYFADYGSTTLSVLTGERGDPSDTLFIGAGSTADVDSYLKGTNYAVAVRDGATWAIREVPGVVAAALPREQDFWLAQDVGLRPAISVPIERPLTIVLMHPSAIASGPMTLSIDFTLPDAPTWVSGLVSLAVVLTLAGLVLLFVVVRLMRRRGRHEMTTSAVDDVGTA